LDQPWQTLYGLHRAGAAVVVNQETPALRNLFHEHHHWHTNDCKLGSRFTASILLFVRVAHQLLKFLLQ